MIFIYCNYNIIKVNQSLSNQFIRFHQWITFPHLHHRKNKSVYIGKKHRDNWDSGIRGKILFIFNELIFEIYPKGLGYGGINSGYGRK